MAAKIAGPLARAQALRHTQTIMSTQSNVVFLLVTTPYHARIPMEMAGMAVL